MEWILNMSQNLNNIEIKPDEIYKHYKGKSYKIITLARHSEDPNLILVIYQGLYDCTTFGSKPIWARPLDMFLDDVIIDDVKQPRFKKVI